MPEGGISIHAVDARNGLPAIGLHVDVWCETGGGRSLVGAGQIGGDALLHDTRLEARLGKGRYEVHFHAGEYFGKNRNGDLLPPLLDVVIFVFWIENPAQHIHLPLKMTPAGYCLFKGNP